MESLDVITLDIKSLQAESETFDNQVRNIFVWISICGVHLTFSDQMKELAERLELQERLIFNQSKKLLIVEDQLRSLRTSIQMKTNEETENLQVVGIVKK